MASQAADEISPAKVTLSLQRKFAYQILAGSKTFESRLRSTNGLAGVQEGDILGFHWYTSERVFARVKKIHVFKNLEQMLAVIPPQKLLPEFSVKEQDAVVQTYEKMLKISQKDDPEFIAFELCGAFHKYNVPPKTESKSQRKKRKATEDGEQAKKKTAKPSGSPMKAKPKPSGSPMKAQKKTA